MGDRHGCGHLGPRLNWPVIPRPALADGSGMFRVGLIVIISYFLFRKRHQLPRERDRSESDSSSGEQSLDNIFSLISN